MCWNSDMTQNIAITGATGFIGSTIARRLLAAGWEIRALTRRTSDRNLLSGFGVRWVEGALDDVDSLKRLVRGVDAVVHCAGLVRAATQGQFNLVNDDGVRHMVQAATEQNSVPRFLLISTLAAREPHLSYYAGSKRQGEEVLTANFGDMPWAVFRPPGVYGPGDRDLLPIFRWIMNGFAPIIGSGKGRFSLLYVDDLAEAVVQWLDHGNRHGCTFELHDGNPEGYSWHDVIDTIARLRGRFVVRLKVPVILVKILAALNQLSAQTLGYAPMLTPGKVRELRHPNWICDNTALVNDTGWAPRILLEEGLRRILK
jgi:nucleoside-diphosphate-sugar epimerase